MLMWKVFIMDMGKKTTQRLVVLKLQRLINKIVIIGLTVSKPPQHAVRSLLRDVGIP